MLHFEHEPRWYDTHAWHLRHVPSTLRSWLIDNKSLTQRLIRTSDGDFRVQIVDQHWARPLHNEAEVLGLHQGEFAFIRQVRLLCHDQPWVFARTVIPATTLHGPLRWLTRLGTKPLGEVLFSHPHIHRENLQISRLKRGQGMYNAATKNQNITGEDIWGRRSVFRFHRHPLLVNEIFLPFIAETD